MYYKKRFFKKPYAAPSPKFKKPSETGMGLTDDCMSWLANYSGQDLFISSLKSQFTQKGELTAAQWKMADKNYRKSLPKVKLPTLSLSTPEPIMVGRTVAFREIRDKYKLQYGVFALKITAVNDAGVARNGNRWAELDVIADADSPVNACRVCGKTLTDHASVVTGIGSVCAKKYFASSYNVYKKNPQHFMAPFKAEVAKLGTMKIKVWENQVKEHVQNFALVVDKFLNQKHTATPVTPTPAPVPVMVAPPKPKVRRIFVWNPKSDPWVLTESGAYRWKMNNNDFGIFLNWYELYGMNLIVSIENEITKNAVEFECPMIATDKGIISFMGYHNGKSICLHIHNSSKVK